MSLPSLHIDVSKWFDKIMQPNVLFLILVNIVFFALAYKLFKKKNILSYPSLGQWWLTWLSIAVITLMDELTSIFYAPSEAFRHIGLAAIVFIPVTAFLVHYMTTRMVEIAEILDVHGLKGGGVYNFSYLVLGPVISFVAVASILVDYVLTASLSTVSAIENASYFFKATPGFKLFLAFGAIWSVALLNILGIRENAKVTFGIFLVTAIVFLNLVISGFMDFGAANVEIISTGVNVVTKEFSTLGWWHAYGFFVMAVSSCILAYSGVESVLQTASLVENWKVIARAYWFLALSVGLLIPVVTVLVLSHPDVDVAKHQTDLMIHYASLLNGRWFGVVLGVVASATLLMAMNTAYVASSELVERVAKRYGFNWIIKTNRRASLYRVHIGSAIFFSFIVYITQGQQQRLAEMYAVGLVASFVINLLSLLIYRYFMGTKEVYAFNVSRFGTLVFFIIIFSCFLYLSYHKPAGFFMWAISVGIALIIGIYGTRKRTPESKVIGKGETPMDIVLYLAEATDKNVNIYFKRPFDGAQEKLYGSSLYVTFYSPRQPLPPKLSDNHFRIPFKKASIFNNIAAILTMLIYEIPDRNLTVHFGWPTSSWFDRLSIGVMVYQFMKFPQMFPNINFKMEKFKNELPPPTQALPS